MRPFVRLWNMPISYILILHSWVLCFCGIMIVILRHGSVRLRKKRYFGYANTGRFTCMALLSIHLLLAISKFPDVSEMWLWTSGLDWLSMTIRRPTPFFADEAYVPSCVRLQRSYKQSGYVHSAATPRYYTMAGEWLSLRYFRTTAPLPDARRLPNLVRNFLF